MSKQRAIARAERERQAAVLAEHRAASVEREAAARARRDRRRQRWRTARLWQHGAGFRRRRESIGLLAGTVVGALVVAYLLSRSIAVTVGVGLVVLIAGPVLAMIVLDKDRR